MLNIVRSHLKREKRCSRIPESRDSKELTNSANLVFLTISAVSLLITLSQLGSNGLANALFLLSFFKGSVFKVTNNPFLTGPSHTMVLLPIRSFDIEISTSQTHIFIGGVRYSTAYILKDS